MRLLPALLLLSTSCVVPVPETEPDHAAIIPVARDGWHMTRHLAQKELAAEGNWRLVFIGDSITQSWEGPGASVWNAHYSGRRALNLGISGDRTQHVLWRLEDGVLDSLSPQMVVVMIGTNNSGDNTSREIADGVEDIVGELRRRVPFAHILLLGTFPRGESADDRRHQVNLGANRLLEGLGRMEKVHYMDISESLLDEDGAVSRSIMPDLLHLSADGYRRWAEAIQPIVEEVVR
ncbi:MAG: GDSL-type esterase/lipase family protein [Planctomycetes bacterium]|nr:GDSL-type esterase/lipase family protein [Planctomycetota bacterium]